eukprot:gene27035-59768_t
MVIERVCDTAVCSVRELVAAMRGRSCVTLHLRAPAPRAAPCATVSPEDGDSLAGSTAPNTPDAVRVAGSHDGVHTMASPAAAVAAAVSVAACGSLCAEAGSDEEKDVFVRKAGDPYNRCQRLVVLHSGICAAIIVGSIGHETDRSAAATAVSMMVGSCVAVLAAAVVRMLL